MKRSFIAILIGVLVLSMVCLTACKSDNSDKADVVTPDNSVVPDDEPAPTPKLYERVDLNGKDIVYFGRAFQTAETESLNATLTNLVNDGILLPDDNGNYVYDGVTYKMLVLDAGMADKSLSDGRTLRTGEKYFFREEKVAWQVIAEDEDALTLLAVNIIDVCVFRQQGTFNSASGLLNDGKTLANDYGTSYVRSYLNGAFADNIFTSDERESLLTNVVDMGKEQSEYSGATSKATLSDKIYLLSHKELKSISVLLPSEDYTYAVEISDYAVALGADAKKVGESGRNYLSWWLRSEGNKNSFATAVPYTGKINGEESLYRTVVTLDGLRPVIKINK